MKIEEILNKAHLGFSGLTKQVYIFIPRKGEPGVAAHKANVTEKILDFVKENKEFFKDSLGEKNWQL